MLFRSRRFEIRGSFFDVGDGKGNYIKESDTDTYEYVGCPETPTDPSIITNAVNANKPFYRKFAVFSQASISETTTSFGSGYVLKLKNLMSDTNTDMPKSLTVDPDDRFYTGQYFVAQKIDLSDTSSSSFSLLSSTRNPILTEENEVDNEENEGIDSSEENEENEVQNNLSGDTQDTSDDTNALDEQSTGGENPLSEETQNVELPETQSSSRLVTSGVHYLTQYYASVSSPSNVSVGDCVFNEVSGVYTYLGYCVEETDSTGNVSKKIKNKSFKK